MDEVMKMGWRSRRGISIPGFISVLLLMFIVFLPNVDALSIGVSPVRVEFNSMLKGGYAERNVRISTSDEGTIQGHFIKLGDISSWIRVEPDDEFAYVSASTPYSFRIIAEPPADIANGVYEGEVRFITDTLTVPQGQVGASVKASVTITVVVTITDQQVYSCSAAGAQVKNTEIGLPFELTWLIRNGGNVRLSPTIAIDVWDRDKLNLLLTRELQSGEVLPTTERTFAQKIGSDALGQGQFWAYIRIDDCEFSTVSTFDVLERGAISDQGELLSVEAPPWVYENDIVPITAKFANKGLRDVEAKFKGNIAKDGKIIQLIETDTLTASPEQVIDLVTFYTPPEPGKYTVTGQVVYNNKITFEKSTIINVQEKKFTIKFATLALQLGLVAVIVLIIFLVRKIRKQKRKGF